MESMMYLCRAEWNRAEHREGREQLGRCEPPQERNTQWGQEGGELRQASRTQQRRRLQFCAVQQQSGNLVGRIVTGDSIYIQYLLFEAEENQGERVFSSHQMTGQAESLMCAVHDDLFDDADGLCVFVDKEVFGFCQAWQVSQPTITNTNNTQQLRAGSGWDVCFENFIKYSVTFKKTEQYCW